MGRALEDTFFIPSSSTTTKKETENDRPSGEWGRLVPPVATPPFPLWKKIEEALIVFALAGIFLGIRNQKTLAELTSGKSKIGGLEIPFLGHQSEKVSGTNFPHLEGF